MVGRGVFRAPKMLQVCKDWNVNIRPKLFTKEADVYSYAIICYENLTRKLPFEGHKIYDYVYILQGKRPKVPMYIDDWVHNLLRRCWQSNLKVRPSRKVLEIFLANSIVYRKCEANRINKVHLGIRNVWDQEPSYLCK